MSMVHIATTAGTAVALQCLDLATTDHFNSHTPAFHGLSDNRLKASKYFQSISLTEERRVCVDVVCNSCLNSLETDSCSVMEKKLGVAFVIAWMSLADILVKEDTLQT